MVTIMINIVLYSTGTCFDDAMDFLEETCKEDMVAFVKNEDLFRLVHAIVDPDLGDPYSHAWVEYEEKFVWSGYMFNNERIFVETPIKKFYERLNVKVSKKYTIKEMLNLNKISGTYGPWEKMFIDLCRQNKRRAK
jgi:hypothetical protein